MNGNPDLRGEFLKAVFGNRHRLDIWAAIGRYSIDPPESFFCQQIKDDIYESRIPTAVTWKEMHSLAELGAIKRITETRGGVIMYHRLESPVWDIVQVAFEAVTAEFPAAQTP